MTFICTTLMPEVRAPASLQRAALRARPVVDAAEVDDEEGQDDEDDQAEIGEGHVRGGEARPVQRQAEALVDEAREG